MSASPVQRLMERATPPNRTAPRVVRALLKRMRDRPRAERLVLIVGGGTRGSGLDELYAADDIDIIAFDVYASPYTHFVADAHRIPLGDASVDAIVVQAVLEHVLDPWQVVAEIHRVLRAEGLVYADTPFLYPVHEGPYDFTRFTDSGHRWLFRRFALLDSGTVAGPGTVLSWSLAQAVRTVLPLRGVPSVVRLLSRPVAAFVDRFGAPQSCLDGAASVYFLGLKSTTEVQPREMVGYYRGAQSAQVQRSV